MKNHPHIELVICTYNNARLLDRTLTALAEQQVSGGVGWKVLVVDNNCTDDTPLVVHRHVRSGRIPGLRILSEPRQGLTHARLFGVKNTTADWIAFIDDDCLLAKDWVEQAVNFARSQPECGAFGGRVVLDWEIPPPDHVLKYGYSFAEQDHGSAAKQVHFLVGAGIVIRRAALWETGWVDRQLLADRVGTKLISGGDVEIALRVAAKYKLWYTPQCRLMHFIPSRRISQKYLVDINYHLGISQTYSNSMLSSRPYGSWLLASLVRTLRSSADVCVQSLKAVRGRKPAAEVSISSSFVRGMWAGILKVMRMRRQERLALFGCARRREAGDRNGA